MAGYLADLGVSHAYSSPLLRVRGGQQPRVRHGRPRAHRRGTWRAGRASTGSSRRCTSTGSASCSTSCRTTWASPTPAAAPWWWDVLEKGQESRVRGGVRHRLGVRRRQGPHPGAAARRTTSGRSSRWTRTASCTTTSTASRSPPAPSSGTPQEVHARQHYELVDWRRADADLNYRRFFAINTLAGLRVEDPAVFDATHELVLQLVRRRRRRRPADRPPRRPRRPGGLPATGSPRPRGHRWRCVEKILEPGEDAARGLGDRRARPATTRCARSTGCSSTRPARRRSTALDTELTGGAVDYAAPGPHEPSARSPTGSSARRSRRLVRVIGDLAAASTGRSRPRRWPSCWRASPCTAATCPTAASTWTPRWPRPRERRPDLAAAVDALHPRAGAGRRPEAGHPLPADQRAGDGQGRRGHAPSTGGPGSSRSTRWAATRRSSAAAVEEFHAAQAPPAARRRPVHDDAVHPRHQAQRGRAGPAGGAGRAARASGPSWCARC